MRTTLLTICGFAVLSVLVSAAPPAAEKPAPFELDLNKALASLGPQDWQVLKDETYSRIAIGQNQLSGRRVVVTCSVAQDERPGIGGDFHEEIERQLAEAGAILKGEESVSRGQVTVRESGSIERLGIEAPRWYYAIGRSFGIFDARIVRHDDRMVLTLSYLQ